MRWSPLVSLLAVLVVTSIIEGVFAAPLDVILEGRGRVTTRSRSAARSRKPTTRRTASHPLKNSIVTTGNFKKLTAASLKTGSSTNRKAALNGDTFTKDKNKIIKIKTPQAPPSGKHADHILEAQTVSKALQKAGYRTTESLGSAHAAIKQILNHHSNLAFVDGDVNIAKGAAQRTALLGNKPSASSHVTDYMKHTLDAGKETAKKIDSVLKQHGITGVSVQKTHQGILNKMGLKRELSLDEVD